MASMYAVYHGPEGVKKIAQRIHLLTATLARGLERLGYDVQPETFFDTLRVDLGSRHSKDIIRTAESLQVNLRVFDAQTLGITLDETTSVDDLGLLLRIFNTGKPVDFSIA